MSASVMRWVVLLRGINVGGNNKLPMVQIGRVIWLHTPQGIRKSKLGTEIGQVIGHVSTTSRNLNTLRRLVEMLDE